MAAGSFRTLQQLQVREGEWPSASKWNGLLDEIEARTVHSGVGVRISKGPRGVIASAIGRGGTGFTAWPFKLSQGATGITFAKGTINGIEPTIGGIGISGPPDGDSPELAVQPGQYVYAVSYLSQGWTADSIEMVAMDHAPTALPSYQSYKLFAIIGDDGSAIPTVFFNLGFYASSRSPASGRARYWYWAT